MAERLYLGIDIGGSSVKAGLVDDAGAVRAHSRAELDLSTGLDRGLETVFATVRELMTRTDPSLIACAGVASPGTMDIDAGIVFHPYNLPGWENLPLRDLIEEELQLPAVLQNDANAAAYGEYLVGAARDASSLIFWTLGTGVGGGIIINGQLVEGAHAHGGECGHIILQMEGGRPSPFGMHGSLECYAGGKALVQRCREALDAGASSLIRALMTQAEPLTPGLIGRAAEWGDPLANRLVLETATYLGMGTASLMNALNPEMVLIGGAMTFGGAANPVGARFLEQVRRTVRERTFPIPAQRTVVDYAQLGNSAGFIGAAGWARLKLGFGAREAEMRPVAEALPGSAAARQLVRV